MYTFTYWISPLRRGQLYPPPFWYFVYTTKSSFHFPAPVQRRELELRTFPYAYSRTDVDASAPSTTQVSSHFSSSSKFCSYSRTWRRRGDERQIRAFSRTRINYVIWHRRRCGSILVSRRYDYFRIFRASMYVDYDKQSEISSRIVLMTSAPALSLSWAGFKVWKISVRF